MTTVNGPRMGVIRSAGIREYWYPDLLVLLRMLDALMMGAVLDKDLATPPVSPSDGDTYIVAGSPTGAWSGHANHIAYWDGTASAWYFYAPIEGFRVWVSDEDLGYAFNGSAWTVPGVGDASTLQSHPASDFVLQSALDTDGTLAANSDSKIATQKATKTFIAAQVAALVNSAPGALDTLKELADALGDDANFATTMTTALAAKAPLASPTFTGTVTLPNGTVSGAMATDNLRDVLPPFVFDGGGSVVTTGTKVFGITIPCSGTLTGWEVFTDLAATVQCDIKKADYATWPTTASIFSTKPSTSAARKNQATGLSIAVTAGDVWEVTVDANDLAKWISLNPHIRRS